MEHKKVLSGSVTVEASLIGTMIVWLIFSAIYLGICMHNQAVTQCYCTYLGNLAAGTAYKNISMIRKTIEPEAFDGQMIESWKSNYEKELQDLKKKAMVDLKQKVYMGNIKEIHINNEFDSLSRRMKCSVSICGMTVFPLRMFGVGEMTFCGRQEVVVFDKIEAIWILDHIHKEG